MDTVEEYFLPKPNATYCCVPQCFTSATEIPRPSFHRFPLKNSKLTKMWQAKLRIAKPITETMKVCCKHFVKDNFFPGLAVRRKHLKKNAIPSKNLPTSSLESQEKIFEQRKIEIYKLKHNENFINSTTYGMPCAVQDCKSNFDSELKLKSRSVPTFAFPKNEELKQKWIEAINGKDYNPTKDSYVCIKHFSENQVVWSTSVVRDDGSVLTMRSAKPRIIANAIPDMLCSPGMKESRNYGATKKYSLNQIHIEAKNSIADDATLDDEIITDYQTFKSHIFKNKIEYDFQIHNFNDFILFYKAVDLESPKIIVALKVYEDLSIQIWHENCHLPTTQFFQWILGDCCKLEKWSQFTQLIAYLSSYS